jgi:biopolymer transport protein ExbB
VAWFRVGLSALVVGLTLVAVPAVAQAPASQSPAPASEPASGGPAPAGPVTTAPPSAGTPTAAEPAAAPAPSPAAPPAPTAAEGARPIGPHGKPMPELSAWSMFMDADILVKGVMLGLAFASVLTWTIFIGKTAELFFSSRRLKTSVRAIEGCSSLLEAQMRMNRRRDVTSILVQQAVQETRLSADIPGDAGLRERVASRFGEVQKTEGRIIRRGMGLLATIGSTSPFVGLFGTVWGIMNSFIGISKSQTTNLAVVAPGIAEALLATAIGLVAAIPAVIVYNHFARQTKGYMEGVGHAAGVVARLLSRDLDRARGRPLAQAAE